MNGFIVVHSNDAGRIPHSCSWKPLFGFQQAHRKQQYRHSGFFAEQYTPDRFTQHKFFEEDEKGFLVTEGLITNVLSLYTQTSCKAAAGLLPELLKTGIQGIEKLRGNFAGVYYDKDAKELLVFNNHTGTQKLYYYKDEHLFAAGTDLKVLSTTLRDSGITLTPDDEAVQMLLSYGFMLGDYTLIKEIRQITAGRALRVNANELTVEKYFDLGAVPVKDGSKEHWIEQLDVQFMNALKEEYEIDTFYSYPSVATLSGGLDSRMTTLAAHRAGYRQELINFSQQGYADEVIARKIADTHAMQLKVVSLTAASMTNIDEVVSVNDGLTLYTGASHVLEALKQINIPNRGILHTGMLGDAIMGSYLKAPFDTAPRADSGAYSIRKSNTSTQILFDNIAAGYRSEEQFMFYNRAFQGINTGYQYLYLFSESLSPFMHPDFIRVALGIPREYMYKERLYIDWILTRHPEQAAFCWENIGGRPTNNTMLRRLYRMKRALVKRLPVQSMWKNSMTPEQLWYENSEEVQVTVDNYFKNHLSHPGINTALRTQLIELYNQRDFTSKAQVLTLLAALKNLFP